MITLHPLDRRDGARVAHITLRGDQFIYAGSVAEALATSPARFDLHEIRQDHRAVGMFKIDRAYADDYPFAGPDDLGLRAVMIDARVQGQGIGKAAMTALRDYLPHHYPQAAAVVLTVNMSNPAAIAVYRAAGFADTRRLWQQGLAGPQYVLRMALR